MKFSLNPRIKSVIVALSDIERLADILTEISKEENKKYAYKREPEFKIGYKDGRAYEFTTKEEFIEQLKLSLSGIEELKLSFWGEHVIIKFSYQSSLLGGWLDLNIESDQKGTLLGYESDIVTLLKKNSYNWIVHEPLIFFPLIFGIWLLFILSLKSLLRLLPKDTDVILSLIFGIIIFALSTRLMKLYPLLVIKDGEIPSGRVLKKDLWKMVIGIIVVIIIPILINKFF